MSLGYGKESRGKEEMTHEERRKGGKEERKELGGREVRRKGGKEERRKGGKEGAVAKGC